MTIYSTQLRARTNFRAAGTSVKTGLHLLPIQTIMPEQTVEGYLAGIENDKREVLQDLRTILENNVPKALSACLSYDMIGNMVPHSL